MNTEKVYHDAKGPWVEMTNGEQGLIHVKLDFYKEKANGDLEEVTVHFNDLNVDQVACIGNTCRRTIWRTMKAFEQRATAAWKRVKGENE